MISKNGSTNTFLLPIALLLAAPGLAQDDQSDDWVSLSGAETLRELVSGTTAEIELKPAVLAGVRGLSRGDSASVVAGASLECAPDDAIQFGRGRGGARIELGDSHRIRDSAAAHARLIN